MAVMLITPEEHQARPSVGVARAITMASRDLMMWPILIISAAEAR